jgi:D-alanine-D-alanine ligase
MMRVVRLRIAVIFGGVSNEHDVSCNSARDVIEALDGYDLRLLGIDRAGRWHEVDTVDDLETAMDGTRLPDLDGIDVAVPVLHGRFGEDGTVQGLLELAGVPYTGCGVLASALAMDKLMAATVLRAAGVPVVDGIASTEALPWDYPVFVKPNRSGSSVGAGRVDSVDDFEPAVAAALEHDDVALVQPVMRGEEVDVGVLQLADGTLVTGAPLRVHPSDGASFFDFAAKYTEGGARFEVPAALDAEVAERIDRLAREAFTALGCDGIARVDFFLDSDGSLVVNEVNTLPGLKARSQFPRMFAAVGMPLSEVLDVLVDRALAVSEGRDIVVA